MRIVNVRRTSQTFFFVLFIWFCIVSSPGTGWMQLRGWPVSWFLQLDPLNALGTILSTGTLYSGLLWALVTVVLTILLGRFFCGWVCPFGAIHHFAGFLGKRGKPVSAKIAVNRYHGAQSVKYYILFFLLTAASGALIASIVRTALGNGRIGFWVIAAAAAALAAFAVSETARKTRRSRGLLLLLLFAWVGLSFYFSADRMIAASLQTGLLDPIPLVHRSINLVLLPLLDATGQNISVSQRFYDGAWVIGALFFAAVLLNFRIPRFYCRFVCPLGALFGILGRFALWKIGRKQDECPQCMVCEANCEGACQPSGSVRIPECVLCMNCLHDCKHHSVTYRIEPSAAGEVLSPNLSRRNAMTTLAVGAAAVPMVRLSGLTDKNWNPDVIRPPGALAEPDFLARCVKCGQCMRVCPTNIIHPAGLEAGVEGIWTPVLNFRAGTSGCQLNCVACGRICPTAAIRPLSLDEKLGRNAFAEAGRIRMGTAFVDRGRCLPWAMDRPCIVCQENCPVSPKAIQVQEVYATVIGGAVRVQKADSQSVELAGIELRPGQFATGDYFVRIVGDPEGVRRRILDNGARSVAVAPDRPFESIPGAGAALELQVRLQKPQVDPERCIGCGICEHECPVSGRRAIRVAAENETRNRKHSLLLRRASK